MTTEKILTLVFEELERAEKLHPNYPSNQFEQIAIWNEEMGEVTKALLDYKHKNAPFEDVVKESIQSIAMGFRFLKNQNRILSEMEQNIVNAYPKELPKLETNDSQTN